MGHIHILCNAVHASACERVYLCLLLTEVKYCIPINIVARKKKIEPADKPDTYVLVVKFTKYKFGFWLV